MDFLCPGLEGLVACHNCNEQTLPPYQLCADAHPVCGPCSTYTRRCRTCGNAFVAGPNLMFDWTVSAMRLRCKYREREPAAVPDVFSCGDGGGRADECSSRWFGVQELREHYRTGCARNTFACPLKKCAHVGRVDTIVEHYEYAHGPIATIEPAEGHCKCEIQFRISMPTLARTEVLQKMFNGYFLFTAKQDLVSIKNINPADPLRYGCEAMTAAYASQMEFTGVLFLVDR